VLYKKELKYAESKGANNWNWALSDASLGGHLDIVKSYSAKQNIDLVYFSREQRSRKKN